MRLTIEETLHRIGRMLSERIAPDVQSDFVAQSARLSGGALNICANWIDDAAAIRVEENAAIRASLGQISQLVESDQAARLSKAANSSDPDLRISELDRENDRLRRLLVEGHTALELLEGEAARALDRQVWQLLEEIEVRRAPRE